MSAEEDDGRIDPTGSPGRDPADWQTKPSDRFVLKWIKCHLSARITPRLLRLAWLRPWMITVSSACLGLLGGFIFALGVAWLAGICAAASQILDGVDGQFARLTRRETRAGAFLDSILDRYADGAMLIGMVVFVVRRAAPQHVWILLVVGGLALIGANLISYSWARARSLGLVLAKRRTLAGKGTRMTVMIFSGLGSVIWPPLPVLALCYLALHSNLSVLHACWIAFRSTQSVPETPEPGS